jgi:deazaflavin-dependent oxidoreductase (nitroreductase family)
MGLIEAAENAYMGIQQAVYERSDGRLGHGMIGVPVLLLRTRGRRSGLVRTAALVYATDGADLVVVASNHGYDQPPGWRLNVEGEPRVEVQIGRLRRYGSARVVSPGDPEYARLWQLVNANNHNRYDGYQARTGRPIDLVVITPD